MISTNSLAAFTQEVSRTRPVAPHQATRPAEGPQAERVAQRKLETVPPPPAQPTPRGSLLDLRV